MDNKDTVELKVSMNIVVDSVGFEDVNKALLYHIDHLMDLDNWPEILQIYDVETIVINNRNRTINSERKYDYNKLERLK